MSDHRAITYRADGTPAWFDPECAACAAGHHPGTIPTPAEVDAWEAGIVDSDPHPAPCACRSCDPLYEMTREGDTDPDETMHPADAAAERSTVAAGDWARAKADGDDDGRARALRAYRAARMVGRAFARPEYRHPAAVGAEYRGPGADATAAEDADGDAPELRPDTVYRFDEGGSIPVRAYCGRCLSWALASDSEPERMRAAVVRASIGAPTAARCEACDLDGAPARWATANRGASLWRALLVGLDGLEVDPLTGDPWGRDPIRGHYTVRPGIEPERTTSGDRWAHITTAARHCHAARAAR